MAAARHRCRLLVKDPKDVMGATRALPGAAAILELRTLISNGDSGRYWRFHLRKEHECGHHARYREGHAFVA